MNETIQVIHLRFHDCVAVVLESSRIGTYASVLCASRLILKPYLGKLASYDSAYQFLKICCIKWKGVQVIKNSFTT